MIKHILLAFLRLYRNWASPILHALFPAGCKFQPTCSEYASEAIAVHGALRGGGMALGRLLRCHPFSRGGFDDRISARARRIPKSDLETPTSLGRDSR